MSASAVTPGHSGHLHRSGSNVISQRQICVTEKIDGDATVAVPGVKPLNTTRTVTVSDSRGAVRAC